MEHLNVVLECKLSALETKFEQLSREIRQIHGDISKLHGCITGCKCLPYNRLSTSKYQGWNESDDDRISVIRFSNTETGRPRHHLDEQTQYTNGHFSNQNTGGRYPERETPSSTTSTTSLMDSGYASTQQPFYDYDSSETGDKMLDDFYYDSYGKLYHAFTKSSEGSPENRRKVDESTITSLFNAATVPFSSKSSIFFPSTPTVDSVTSSRVSTRTNTSESIYATDRSTTEESSLRRSTDQEKATQTSSMSNRKVVVEEDYVLPEKVTAAEVIDLWENGGDNFPPLKNWTPKQKLKQKSKVSRWRKLVQIYYDKFKGDMDCFVKECTDKHGQQFTVSAILNSHREDEGVDIDVELSEPPTSSRPVNTKTETPSKGSTPQKPRYVLPRKLNGNQVSALDIITLWEEGAGNVPPIRLWPPIQKMRQQSKISRWRKIMKLYKAECEGNIDTFREKYTDELGKPYSVGKIIALKRKSRSLHK